jgi:hypothetical protein
LQEGLLLTFWLSLVVVLVVALVQAIWVAVAVLVVIAQVQVHLVAALLRSQN